MTGILRDAADLLAQRAVNNRLGQQAGASSFFSKPSQTLDPHLFAGKELLPDVRQWILGTLYRFWGAKYRAPERWSQVWIAGSGATYQWDAMRSVGEPGDLDVLIGVDFPTFWQYNPALFGIGEAAQAELFNDEFRSGLDHDTDHANINGQVYETTFYVNPGATDIKDINPYAAISVTTGRWDVPPPDLPADWNPFTTLPGDWWDAIAADELNTSAIVEDYNMHSAALRRLHPSDPHWINNASLLHETIRHGAELFDQIHTGRHESFKPGGGGFTGYQNVRWQYGKLHGYLHNLHTLKDLWTSAHANRAERCDGTVPLDAAHALTLAAMVGGQTA